MYSVWCASYCFMHASSCTFQLIAWSHLKLAVLQLSLACTWLQAQLKAAIGILVAFLKFETAADESAGVDEQVRTDSCCCMQ